MFWHFLNGYDNSYLKGLFIKSCLLKKQAIAYDIDLYIYIYILFVLPSIRWTTRSDVRKSYFKRTCSLPKLRSSEDCCNTASFLGYRSGRIAPRTYDKVCRSVLHIHNTQYKVFILVRPPLYNDKGVIYPKALTQHLQLRTYLIIAYIQNEVLYLIIKYLFFKCIPVLYRTLFWRYIEPTVTE